MPRHQQKRHERPAKSLAENQQLCDSCAEELGNGITLEMIAIPGGMVSAENEKGASSEGHEVTVKPFFMGKYPITQAQWRAIANRTDLKVERDIKPDPSNFKGDDRPVEQVSWDDAVEFCARLSKLSGQEYRLPSEVDWEYACRAGTTTPFYFGETITSELANYDASYTFANKRKGQCRGETTPVGQFLPNAFGLYDTHGNVWEWCTDVWHVDSEDDYLGLNGDDDYRVLRGGSWYNDQDDCKSSARTRHDRGCNSHLIGFRVVLVNDK